MPFGEALQRPLDVAARVARLGNARDAEGPELAVGGGPAQAVLVLKAERFEADTIVREDDRQDGLHPRARLSGCAAA